MPKPERKGRKKPARAKAARAPRRKVLRKGGTRLGIRSSGRELWLYDEAHRTAIREAGPGMGGAPGEIPGLMRAGTLLGVSLPQDDDLDLEIHVGKPLSEAELAAARWLEPQTAFLRVPSGTLCVESNDASRIGPETPAEKGARVEVPPGDYRVTLYRIDGEALFREQIIWEGPAEVFVLTPGGTAADAADELLAFEPRRDTTWIGKYTIEGRRAEVLAWFDNYWGAFALNLDAAAVAALGIVRGSYLLTRVPEAGLTLISVYGETWDDAAGLPPPDGVDLAEYGYAALQHMADWDGASVLWCRRETAKTRVEAPLHAVWTPATVEVLNAPPSVLEGRRFVPTDLGAKPYFDPGFLTMVLAEVLPEVADLDELPLPDALERLDAKLAKLELTPQGDVSWQERERMRVAETSARLYAGPPDRFAVTLATAGDFAVMLLSELVDETWIVTGLADEIDRRMMKPGPNGLPLPHPRVRLECLDEPLAKIASAHQASLEQSTARPVAAPAGRDECVESLRRFLEAAFG